MICLALLITGVNFAVVLINSLHPNRNGPEFEKQWECDKYQISFVSDDEKFPFFHNDYRGSIRMDGTIIKIIVYVGNGEFMIGNYEHEQEYYGEEVDFIEYATGTYSYSRLSHTLVVEIDSTNDDYSFLRSKELIFNEINT